MRKLLLTTAMAAAFGGAAIAQTAASPTGDAAGAPMSGRATAGAPMTGTSAGPIQGTDLIGARIYAADYEGDPQAFHARGADWDDIGEVSDVLVTPSGDVAAVIVDVGGFLGVGERVIAVGMNELSFIRTGDAESDWRAVIDRSRQSLETQPEFDADTARAQNGWMSMGETTAAGMTAREGWVAAKQGEYSIDDLRGATVYGPEDEAIGEINDVVLSQSGSVQAAVVDVGGFLGLGERSVAIPFTQMTLLREENGDDLRIYVAASEEQLRELPEHRTN